MRKIKILSILMAVLVTTMDATNANAAYEANTGQQMRKMVNEIYLSEEDVFEALAHTFGDESLQIAIASESKFSPSGARIQSFDAKSYSEYTSNEYGGMYLDENGKLMICYVNGSTTMQSEKNALSQMSRINKSTALTNLDNEVVAENYAFKAVKYSENELLNAYELVNKSAVEDKIIKSADIDVYGNRVIVGIEDIADVPTVREDLIKINGMYAFELLEDDLAYQDCATINGTSPIGNGSVRSTPAGKVYTSSIRDWGIVTCGHGWAAGDTVYSGDTKVGSIKYQHYDGKNDSSLIVMKAGHSYQDTKHDEFDSSIPVVGSTLTLRGFVSGKISGAKVLSTNASATTSGTYFTGMIKCDKAVKAGDSGGGAIGKYIDGGRTAVILGINKASNGSNTVLIKGKVICDAY